ncbi:MAG: coproporphyrinogen III oxidase [Alphaproteobacteria bacterium]|nr:coproporphyrinogen III oxidase [Alphaproteobacteria bacterium]
MNSLAVYIHWPFCLSKCPYCDFNSHVREKVEMDRWQAALLRELDYMHTHTAGRTVTSIFFGGGTPSLMPPSLVAALIDRVHALWPCSNKLEITLEANPTSVEIDKFRELKAAGVERASLGVQSLRQEELSFLGRGHSVQEAKKAIAYAAEVFERFSFDLIYARPNQTLKQWEEELKEALALARGHLSLYQLTIEENTAFYHAYAKGAFAMPDEETAEALYRLTEEITGAHGLHAYEVSNYAGPDQKSRHNLSYWQGDDYIGVGPGAHGRVTEGGVRYATQTLKSPERWLENVEKRGNGVELWDATDLPTQAMEMLMMGLRLSDGIDYESFISRHGFDLRDHINTTKIRLYQSKGLLERDDDLLKTTLAGRLVLNRLTAELL